MTTVVKIPKDDFHGIHFPDACPACGKISPDSTTDVGVMFSAYKPLNEEVFKTWNFHLPCCRGCVNRIRWGRRYYRALQLFMTLAAAAAILLTSVLVGKMGTFWSVVNVVFFIGLAVYLTGRIYSPPFDAEPFADRLEIMFGNDSCGEEFARLNGQTVVYDENNQDRPLPPAAVQTCAEVEQNPGRSGQEGPTQPAGRTP